MNLLITGATGNLGRVLADQFLAGGARVIGLQRGQRDELADHPRYRDVAHDLADVDAIATLATGLGPIDVVVHAAVRCEPDPAGGVPLDEIERHVRVNALAPLALSRALIAAAGERPTHHIFFGTRSSSEPELALAAYATSKAALAGLVRHLSRTLVATPHTASTIVLGSLATDAHHAEYDDTIAAALGAAAAADLAPGQRDQARRMLFARSEPRATFPDLIPLATVPRVVRALIDLGVTAHGAVWRLDHGLDARG